ncbi:lasso RiPP family leader peptide-containing protein [Streptomyces sp. NPDC050315]|uniref:lasso RiPP family leader peptide-containing protein n=1 Tax=Streptomyces sp. NPDC050315 TaxID=3155039 RepID=UPI00343EF2E0
MSLVIGDLRLMRTGSWAMDSGFAQQPPTRTAHTAVRGGEAHALRPWCGGPRPTETDEGRCTMRNSYEIPTLVKVGSFAQLTRGHYPCGNKDHCHGGRRKPCH